MNYKHLMEKIDQSYARVRGLTMIALEVAGYDEYKELEGIMESFNDEDLDVICKTLDWKRTPEVLELLEEEIDNYGLPYVMYKNDKGGFLAEVAVPECSNIKFDDKGQVISCDVSTGISRLEWVYADTLDELSDKIVETGERVFKEFVKKQEAIS